MQHESETVYRAFHDVSHLVLTIYVATPLRLWHPSVGGSDVCLYDHIKIARAYVCTFCERFQTHLVLYLHVIIFKYLIDTWVVHYFS